MRFSREQGDLPADELGILRRATPFAEERHLAIHLGNRMSAVDADAVGVGGEVARFAAEVARGEDAVGPFAARELAAQHLTGRPHSCGQLVPALFQGRHHFRVGGPRAPLQFAQPSTAAPEQRRQR